MKVLVVGASRGIGHATVRYALACGIEVRALARRAVEMPLEAANLEKVSGDATDPLAVAAALDGVDAVVETLGVAPSLGRALRPVHLFSQATEVLIGEMRRAGVRRLVAVTGFGAGESRAKLSWLERLPFDAVLGQAYADKTRQEALIRESGLDWTLVRPTILTNGRMTGRYRVLVDPSEWRSGMISRADVGHYLVRTLGDPATIGTAPVLAH